MPAEPTTLPSLPRLPRLEGLRPLENQRSEAPSAPSEAPPVGPTAATRTIRLGRPLDLAATLGPIRRGRGDPCLRVVGDHVWRATWTPEGPATVHLHHVASDRVVARAWGPGASWAIDRAPDLIGEHDDLTSFDELLEHLDGPHAAQVRRLRHRAPGLRIPRSFALAEALFGIVLEQRVTTQSARRSYRSLVRAHGEPAPAAPGLDHPLILPPHPSTLAALPVWEYHRHNVEARRAETIRRVSAQAATLDEAARTEPVDAVTSRLLAIDGVGAWSVAEATRAALGDPDAVSVGDHHLPHHVAFALCGAPRSDDTELLALLEPFRGHRGRACQLIVGNLPGPPRRGPKRRHRDITRH